MDSPRLLGPQEFQNLAQQIDGIPRTEELAYLLGFQIGPTPPGFPPISDFPGISSLYGSLGTLEAKADALAAELAGLKADLDDRLDSAKVDLEIVEQARFGDAFVMLSSENGKPVDAVVTHVFAVSDTASDEVEWVATTLQSGLIRLNVVLPPPLRSTRVFLIQVEHAHGADTVHAGSTLARRFP